jgi:DNA-binding MarR family transcriptional regulator
MNIDLGDDPLRLDRQVCFPLYAASNLISRRYRPALTPLGLTYPQYLVMLVLWEHTPQTVGSLGEALYLDSGTLTPLLKRMEQAGLIRRARDPMDERRVLVALTRRGASLRSKALGVPQTLAQGFSGDPSSLVDLREMVRTLLSTLADHGDPSMDRVKRRSQEN